MSRSGVEVAEDRQLECLSQLLVLGPSGSPHGDAPGHVCIAVVGAVSRTAHIETADENRAANMDLFARYLLVLFEQALAAPTGS